LNTPDNSSPLSGAGVANPLHPRTATSLRDTAIALGVPLNSHRQPALHQRVPNRYISIQEAQHLGMSLFWPGTPCLHGHIAARYVSNSRMCVDCRREQQSLPAIYPRSPAFAWTSDLHRTFCEAWARTGSILEARRAVSCPHLQMVRDELEHSPAFRTLFEEAALQAAYRQLGAQDNTLGNTHVI
jgi:hypothetical protein